VRHRPFQVKAPAALPLGPFESHRERVVHMLDRVERHPTKAPLDVSG
jgi:hypothetical protein